MPQLQKADARAAASVGAALSVLRFLVADRIGVLALVWAVIALLLRPFLLDVHHDGGGSIGNDLRALLGGESLARLTALVQWVAFALPVAVAAMIHVRVAHTGRMKMSAAAGWLVGAGYLVLLAGGYLAFLWAPQSVFTLMTHDSFIFIDSTYRIDEGLVPSVDFPTPIGAAALYLPWLGAKLAGGYAGSLELASVLVALVCGLIAVGASVSRFPIAVTVALAAFVFLIAVPSALLENWGEVSLTVVDGQVEVLADDLTWAMFYNRWGWATLLPLFLFLAPRRDRAAPELIEIACFAAGLFFLFYLKLTYFVIGAATALAWAFLNPRPVRTLLIGAGATLGLVLGAGLVAGYLLAYLRDVAFAAGVSGSRSLQLLSAFRENIESLLLACAPLAILMALGRATWRDGAVTGLVVFFSIVVLNQNAQQTNIVSLVALGAYGVARIWAIEEAGRTARVAAGGVFLMLAAGVLFDRSVILIDQTYALRREENRPPADWASIPALKGVYIPEREDFFDESEEATSPDERRRIITLTGEFLRRQELRQGEYMATVLAGVAELKPVLKPGDSIVTLDMANPFPALMNARSAKGSWLTMHAARTISYDKYPAAEEIFADADHVMIAKNSMVPSTSRVALKTYGDWLRAHYAESSESTHWHRFSRKKPAA